MNVVLGGSFVHELAHEHEAAGGAEVGVEVEALLEVGRDELEVGLAALGGGGDGGGQLGEADGGGVEQNGLCTGGIVEGDARGGGAGLGDGLLVEDDGAGLAAHGGQAVVLEGEGLADAHGRRVVGPGGAVGDGERGAGDGVADVGAIGVFGPEVG